MKRKISVILVIFSISLFVITSNALAVYRNEPQFIYDIKDDGNIVITDIKEDKNILDIVIPAEIDGHPVKEVKCALSHSAQLIEYNKVKTLTLENGIEKIDIDAGRCHDLEKVILPDSIVDLGNTNFKSSKITDIKIPNNVKVIPKDFCRECLNLKHIDFGSSVNEIGSLAFFKTAVTDIELPDGLKILDGFTDCKGLTSVSVPNSVEIISNFSGCSNLKTINIPKGTKTLLSTAFMGTAIENIDIPNTVTKIGSYCFKATKLKEIKLPDSLIELGEYAFQGCNELKKVDIPKNLIRTSNNAFQGCISLNDVKINEPMNSAIYETLIDTPWIEKYNSSVDGGFVIFDNYLAGYGGTDKNPVIPPSINKIGEYAFRNSDIDTVTLSPNIKEIPSRCFAGSKIKEIVIPSNVKQIKKFAFLKCYNLEKITFEEGVEKIEEDAFMDCYSLVKEKVSIPKSVKVASKAFRQTPLDKDFTTNVQWNTDAPKPTATPAPDASPAPTGTPKPADAPQTLTVQSGDALTIEVNGKTVNFPDAQPFIDENGRTQVPIRAVSELLDCKVDWLQDIKTAVITKSNGDIVKITLDSDIMTVNDKQIKMDTTAVLKDDRTFIPVRFTAEALGLTVNWSE